MWKNLSAKLHKPYHHQFIFTTMLCLVLIAILIANRQLFFDAPNDVLGNWIYIFFFLCLGIVLFFIKFLFSPPGMSKSQITITQALSFSVLFGSLWYFTLEIIYNENLYLMEGKYVFWVIILVTSGQRSCNTRTRFLQHPDKIPVTCGQHSCIIRTESA